MFQSATIRAEMNYTSATSFSQSVIKLIKHPKCNCLFIREMISDSYPVFNKVTLGGLGGGRTGSKSYESIVGKPLQTSLREDDDAYR